MAAAACLARAQNGKGYYQTEVKVYDDPEQIMNRAFDAVFATVRPLTTSLRIGAVIVGVHRVANCPALSLYLVIHLCLLNFSRF
jgi:glutamate dehydrogenase/leucine dehydrogenase